MPRDKCFATLYSTLFLLLLLLATTAWGERKIIYSFTGLADGSGPAATLVRDANGNLYGTAPLGGNQAGQCLSLGGCGVIFELTPNPDGTWTEITVHTFLGGTDGIQPHGSLIFDSAGNLYGTTIYGGNGCGGFYSCGTVYELSPDGKGSWTETILYNFQGGTDGNYPQAGLTSDTAGNLYGTTGFGGNSGCNTCGTVFELTPTQNGNWSEHVLYTFQDAADGAEPGSPLTFDKAGNLYGTAAIGGSLTCNPPYGCGTIYELVPGPGGWTESVLQTFDCSHTGCFPSTGLAIDSNGSLFGNVLGGAGGFGSVFRLSRSQGEVWKFAKLHVFDFAHGAQPDATPVFDTAGRLYGTTVVGGAKNHSCNNGCGGIFRLANNNGRPSYSFLGFGPAPNGALPEGSLTFDAAGNAYGTTSAGGANRAGTVFEVTP